MNTVSNRVLQDWLQVTKARGHDLKILLRASGIPWQCYESPRSHISGEQLGRLNLQIRRLLNDQFMGYGREVVSSALLDRVLIKILARARTLRELLTEWENFWNLVQDNGRVTSDFHKNEFLYRFKFNGRQQPGTYVWILRSTLFKLQLFSWMIGKQIKPKVIGIAEPAVAGANDCTSLLPAPILFDQAQNFFSIDKHYLNCPIIRTPEECLDYKKYLPGDFFAIPEDERNFAATVRRNIQEGLKVESRVPRIDCVAEKLSVSTRGLTRKLRAEGASFQNLKNQVRRELALEKLTRSEIPIGEIAADLGFSETSAFCRAFRIWTASTPLEYRSRLAAAYRPK